MFGGVASKGSVLIVADFRRVVLASPGWLDGVGRSWDPAEGLWGPMGHEVREECAELKLT